MKNNKTIIIFLSLFMSFYLLFIATAYSITSKQAIEHGYHELLTEKSSWGINDQDIKVYQNFRHYPSAKNKIAPSTIKAINILKNVNIKDLNMGNILETNAKFENAVNIFNNKKRVEYLTNKIQDINKQVISINDFEDQHRFDLLAGYNDNFTTKDRVEKIEDIMGKRLTLTDSFLSSGEAMSLAINAGFKTSVVGLNTFVPWKKATTAVRFAKLSANTLNSLNELVNLFQEMATGDDSLEDSLKLQDQLVKFLDATKLDKNFGKVGILSGLASNLAETIKQCKILGNISEININDVSPYVKGAVGFSQKYVEYEIFYAMANMVSAIAVFFNQGDVVDAMQSWFKAVDPTSTDLIVKRYAYLQYAENQKKAMEELDKDILAIKGHIQHVEADIGGAILNLKNKAIQIINGLKWEELSENQKEKLAEIAELLGYGKNTNWEGKALWLYTKINSQEIPFIAVNVSNPKNNFLDFDNYIKDITDTIDDYKATLSEIALAEKIRKEKEAEEIRKKIAELRRQAEIRKRIEEIRRKKEEERIRLEEIRKQEEEEAASSVPPAPTPKPTPTPAPTPTPPPVAAKTWGGAYKEVENVYSTGVNDTGNINLSGGGTQSTTAFKDATEVGGSIPLQNMTMTVTGKYNYSAWGEWNGGTAFAPIHRQAIVGYPTEISDMPKTGSATYSGQLQGDFWDTNGPFAPAGPYPQQTKTLEPNAIGGTVQLNADFANSSISGSLNATHNGTPFASATFNTGISGASYNGSLSSGSGSGTIGGGFYGPNAEETGGTFQINKNDGTGASGIFHAKQ